MSYLINFIKGICVGVANIIPGVSGGTIAVIVGIYEKLINILGNILHDLKDFKKLKEDLKFIIPIGFGAASGIFLLSKLLGFLLEYQKIPTLYCFIGLILGSLPLLFKKANSKGFNKKYIIPFLITLTLMITLSYLNSTVIEDNQINEFNTSFTTILKIVFYGFISAGTMIIPGISGSMVMMILGIYAAIIHSISSLNLFVLVPFAVGIALGIIIVSKIIDKLLEKFYGYTFYAILGFVIGSIIFVFPGFALSMPHIVGILAFLIGFFVSYLISKKSK